MQIEHYLAALVLVAILNWTGRRFASRQANRLMFLATAAAPIVLWVGLIIFLLVRDGTSTFADPNFSLLLTVAAVATAVTSAVALLGQTLGRPRSGAKS